jgi:hypothetical protein
MATSTVLNISPGYTEDAPAAADPVGSVNILVRKDTLASEVSADGDNIAQRGTSKGEAYTKDRDLLTAVTGPSTSATSNASVEASAFTVLASNANRKGCILYLDGDVDVKLLLCATGTVSSILFSTLLQGRTSFVLEDGDYTGIITGIATSASGTIRCTEFTA